MNKPAIVSKPLGTITTRDGALVDLEVGTWSILANGVRYTFNFSALARYCTPRTLDAIKRFLSHSLVNHSLSTARNYFFHIELFCKYVWSSEKCVVEEILASHILNYHASLEPRRRWYVGVLAAGLRTWHSLGYHGVSTDTRKILDELSPGGNPTGEAVLTRDPHKGPLSDVEL